MRACNHAFVAIPHTIDEVTAAWLSDALATGLPGLVVDEATLSGYIRGASTKARLRLRTNRNDAPVSVIVKAGFEPHSHAMRSMHDNEMHAYRDLIPTLAVNAPHCFFAGRDEAGHSLVILEDLDERGVRFLSLQEPIGFDLAAGYLDALARIHARWWGVDPRRDGFAWVPDTSPEHFQHYFGILRDPARFDAFAQSPRCAAMPRDIVDSGRVQRAFAAMNESQRGQPMVVNHGDMHLGNLYTDADGMPGLLDWQPRLAPLVARCQLFPDCRARSSRSPALGGRAAAILPRRARRARRRCADIRSRVGRLPAQYPLGSHDLDAQRNGIPDRIPQYRRRRPLRRWR